MKSGIFYVTGKREYRGHTPGTIFVARLDRNAVSRAVNRGDISYLGSVTPGVPRTHTFPEGWLAPNDNQERREALLS